MQNVVSHINTLAPKGDFSWHIRDVEKTECHISCWPAT